MAVTFFSSNNESRHYTPKLRVAQHFPSHTPSRGNNASPELASNSVRMSTDISSTVSLIPGQVMMSGSTTVDVSMPRLCRAVSTPRLNGFIVNWCRFSKSNPLLGSFHHLNHSSILTRGSNKFFEENIVTPMQYQEVKKLRHNPYVGGGYIRSHANLFRDLQYGYWAKERMAAREERKKALVRETKRPRLTPAQSVSSVSSEDSTASSLDWSLASPSLSLSPASIDSSASDLTEEGRVAKSFSYDSIESKSPRTRRNSRVIPASLLDANHGTSRKFEDFYSLEKGAALGIRHMPKLSLVNNSPASKQSQNNAPSSETKISYSARQLGTSATSGSMVGRGAYSSVRVGTHLQSGDRFAIKQIAKRFLYSEDEREAIRREVRIHSQSWLAHQNIVFLYDYFEDEHFFYLVMDHCEGGDLETYMRKHKRKGVTEWQAQMLFMQLMKVCAIEPNVFRCAERMTHD